MLSSYIRAKVYDTVLVVVDYYTKIAQFIPITTNIAAPEFATLFHQNIKLKYSSLKGIVRSLEARKLTVLDLLESEQEDPEEFSADTDRLTGVNPPVAIGTLKRGPPELATPERPRSKVSRVLEPTPNQPSQANQSSQPS